MCLSDGDRQGIGLSCLKEVGGVFSKIGSSKETSGLSINLRKGRLVADDGMWCRDAELQFVDTEIWELKSSFCAVGL